VVAALAEVDPRAGGSGMIKRFLQHLFMGRWRVHHLFPDSAMQEITAAIKSSENTHRGEICFAVEASLSPVEIFQRRSGRDRAIDVFSQLRIWDTEENTGVLIYLLLADHDIEIIADRGIHRAVNASTWEEICKEMEAAFRAGLFSKGVVEGIKRITHVLATHFPSAGGGSNELPDKPVIL